MLNDKIAAESFKTKEHNDSVESMSYVDKAITLYFALNTKFRNIKHIK